MTWPHSGFSKAAASCEVLVQSDTLLKPTGLLLFNGVIWARGNGLQGGRPTCLKSGWGQVLPQAEDSWYLSGVGIVVKWEKDAQIRGSYMGEVVSAGSTLCHHPWLYCPSPWQCKMGPFHAQSWLQKEYCVCHDPYVVGLSGPWVVKLL